MKIEIFHSNRLKQVGIINGHDLYRIVDSTVVVTEVCKETYYDFYEYKYENNSDVKGVLLGLLGKTYYKKSLLLNVRMVDSEASIAFLNDFFMKTGGYKGEVLLDQDPLEYYLQTMGMFMV